MKTLYHITKIKYLESIFKHGLIPNFEIGFVTTPSKFYEKAVFLTDDVDFICSTQLTPQYMHDIAVLNVNCNNLIIEHRFAKCYITPIEIEHEFICYDTIPALNLSKCS